jgi:hypothetical protein
VSRFPFKFKADRELHLCSAAFIVQKIAQFNYGV